MSNNYFQFKQFTIHQDRCAMKVCTDACLFGSMLPVVEKEIFHVLDIGTGTGLLSLMLAQRSRTALIDALEIETGASSQAAENFLDSPWADRLNGIHTDALLFNPTHPYDLIISNPPFFEGDLLSGDQNKNSAKHDRSLTLQQLAGRGAEWLAPEGSLALLLPDHRLSEFEEMARLQGLYLQKKIRVRQSPKHDFFRGIMFFKKKQSRLITDEIVIRKNDGEYSEVFKSLLSPYYLNL